MHAVVGPAETLDLELKQVSTALGATVPCPGRIDSVDTSEPPGLRCHLPGRARWVTCHPGRLHTVPQCQAQLLRRSGHDSDPMVWVFSSNKHAKNGTDPVAAGQSGSDVWGRLTRSGEIWRRWSLVWSWFGVPSNSLRDGPGLGASPRVKLVAPGLRRPGAVHDERQVGERRCLSEGSTPCSPPPVFRPTRATAAELEPPAPAGDLAVIAIRARGGRGRTARARRRCRG